MTATPAARRIPDEVDVVEVDGSRFLLQWLDREVLLAAAVHRMGERLPAPAGERAA